MKKALSILATATLASATLSSAVQAEPWSLRGGEGPIYYWDISHKDAERRDKKLYLVVHTDRSRWISPDRVRVEFSIRTGKVTGSRTTWQPSVLYDESTRCDHGAVCDPPLFPVIGFVKPYNAHDVDVENKWYTHSATVNCKYDHTSYLYWEPQDRKLGMERICRRFRTTVK